MLPVAIVLASTAEGTSRDLARLAAGLTLAAFLGAIALAIAPLSRANGDHAQAVSLVWLLVLLAYLLVAVALGAGRAAAKAA